MKWLPIDTAPKDGTFILTYSDENLKLFPGEDLSEINTINSQRWHEGWSGWGWYKDCDEYGDKVPTHWMPLPEAPKF